MAKERSQRAVARHPDEKAAGGEVMGKQTKAKSTQGGQKLCGRWGKHEGAWQGLGQGKAEGGKGGWEGGCYWGGRVFHFVEVENIL